MIQRVFPALASFALLTSAGCSTEPIPPDPGSTPADDDDDDDDGGDGTIDDLIDDMEDDDGSIISEGTGRAGAWYTYNDESADGEQTPAMGADFAMTALDEPRDGSTLAANTVGQGFGEWGAGFGFDLNFPEDGEKSTYDASGYSSLVFWARRGEGGPSTVLVTLNDDQTSPEGGQCDETADECHDHFAYTVRLSDEWELHTVPFAELAQEGWGKQFDEFHANAVYAIQFQIATNEVFDVWIDDIGFGK